MNRVKVSKLMAYILRHSPEEFGLKPDGEGFVPLEKLVKPSIPTLPRSSLGR